MTQSNFENTISNHFSVEHADYLKKIIDYTTKGGKNSRSMIFTWCLGFLNSNPRPDIASLIEYLQAAFILVDDIMDNGTLRRGKPCWHLLNKRSPTKDGLLITKLISLLLKEIIKDQNIYIDTIKCLNKTILVSCIGQTHDAMHKDVKTWDDVERLYNRENYEMICFGKNSYYTFYFPLKLAYILSEKKIPENLKPLCDLFGLWHQVRDDFLNFFPEKSKKDGLDIQERKLTWIICRMVQNGYDKSVFRYLKSGDTDYVEKKALEYLPFYDLEVQEIQTRINALRDHETDAIIAFCESLLK